MQIFIWSGWVFFPQSKGRNTNKTAADILKVEATIAASVMDQ